MSAFAEVWRNPYVRVAVYLLLAYLGYRLVGRVSGVLTLAALSYLFAYLFNPLVERSRRRGIPRPVGVVLVFVVVVLFLLVASLLVGSIITQLVDFSTQLPMLVNGLRGSLQDLLGGLLERLRILRLETPELQGPIDQATQAVQNGLADITQSLVRFLQGSGINFITGLAGVLGNVLQAFLVLIIGGYMLSSFPQIGRNLLELFPRRLQPLVLDLAKDVNTAVGGYIRGQLIVALAVGTMVGVGLAILGIPLALALGFIAGVFNIVPYLGAIISIAPALLLAIPDGLVKVILVVLVFVVANQVEANILSPVILSRSTDLHPVTVILAILAGVALYGILGGLLAVPIAALLKLLVRKYWLRSTYHDET